MSVITENNKDHLLNYEGVEQLLVKINDRFARTDRYATPDTLGMIRAEINTDVNSEDISTGDNHPVQITTDGNAFVNINVPTADDFDFAAADHTHHEINNDFIVTSADGTNEASISVISENGVNINATGDDRIYNTSLKVKDTGVDVYIDDMEMTESTSIVADSNSVSVNSSNIHLTTYDGWEDNHINITDTIDIGCYYEDMDYTQEDVIRIDGGVEITSSVEDMYTQNQSSISNKSDEINITTYANSGDGMSSYYESNTHILLHKTDANESEIVITADKTLVVDDGESSIHNNTSGEITIFAGNTQSEIFLSADNIRIISNNNAASNKVFTTNGGIATLPTIPSSLPANGGNADTVDGKHASDFAPVGHTHDRFTSDIVHFDGAIHICNRSTNDYDDESGEEYDHISGIYFSDNVEDDITGPAYTFIREEGDDRLRVHSNYELKLSTGHAAIGNDTDDIDGPSIRIISEDEDDALVETILMDANMGVYVNGNEVATKNDIPTTPSQVGAAPANHNHTISVTSTFIPNVTSSYNNGVLTILGATTNVQCTGTTDVENTNANPESWFVDPEDMTALF